MKTRLHRSELAVPGSNVRMLEKAPSLGADVVMLDLEDAVAPDDKEQARVNVIDALIEQDWARGSVSVRINGHGPRAPDRPRRADRNRDRDGERRRDRPGLPGAHGGDDLRGGRLRRLDPEPHGLDRRGGSELRGVDRRRRRRRARAPLGRPVALSAGAHRGHLPRARPTADRRALRRLHRRGGLRGRGHRSAVLGYEGKWAIHPSQVPLANEVFTPAPRLVERTRRIVEAMRDAATQGKGAVSLDGRLIDAASIRMAENLLAKLEQIEARQAEPAGTPLRQIG